MSIDFSVLLHATESVAAFFVIGFIGYLMARRGWFAPGTLNLFSRMVMVGALPIYLVYNIDATISRDELPRLAYGLMVPMLSIAINLCAGYGLARLLGVAPARRGVLCASFGFSNTMYIGLPINMALFGEEALPYVIIYFLANAVLFWTVGNYLLASDGNGREARLLSLDSLRKILSPPILGIAAGVAIMLLGVKLPAFLANSGKYMGGMITPLVIIGIGAAVNDMGVGRSWFGRDMLLAAFGRFAVSPLVIIVLTWLFPVPPLMRMVYIIQASLPVMSNVGMLTAYHRKGDVNYAAVVISMTTLLSFLTVPWFMLLATNMA